MATKNTQSKDIDVKDRVESKLVESSGSFNFNLDDALYMEQIKDRTFFLTNEVDECIFGDINSFIIRCNAIDKKNNIKPENRVPIKIFINSCGGSVWDGLSCIEAIRISKTPVYGIVTGYALSMAFNILINCHKRFATKNAFLLNHEGEEFNMGHPSKVKDYMAFEEKLNNRLNDLIIERSNLTKKDLTKTERIENYIFADEAVEMGLIDKIITSFDEIV